MPQPLSSTPQRATPSFYVTPTQRMSLRSLLPALLLASLGLATTMYALKHNHHAGTPTDNTLFGSGTTSDDNDDPASTVDTIYLGGPDQAPTITRPAAHPSTVHPFVVVKLPRSGDQAGQIPETPAGRLLYNWLAVFNSKDPAAAVRALPAPGFSAAEAAQVELRRQTGGFTLLSAREIQPGLLVFRVEDQKNPRTEALGTLQLNPTTTPASIASFSLRAIPDAAPKPKS